MDMIAEIRRRHWVSKESISSIARDLKLSRPTVRKHCRTQSEPVYHRQKQPTPMLGAFQDTLETWLRTERLLPKAQRRTRAPVVRGIASRGVSRCLRQRAAVRATLEGRQIRPGPDASLRSVSVCSGRGLSVRLEPRTCRARWRYADHQGCAFPADVQPPDVRRGLPQRDPGDGVRRAQPRLRLLRRRPAAHGV